VLQCRRERTSEVSGGRETFRWFRLQRAFDRAQQVRLPAQAAGILSRCTQRGHVRIFTGQQPKQHGSGRIDVAGDRWLAALQHFRRQVFHRAGNGQRRFGVEFAGDAEIHQHDAAGHLAHDVFRLDVAMQETVTVHRRHGPAQIQADLAHFLGREASVAHQLHPQSGTPVFHRRAVHADDVRVPHPRQAPRFGKEFVAERVGIQAPQLERHLHVQHRIVGAPDLALGTLAQPLEDPQRTKGEPARTGCRGLSGQLHVPEPLRDLLQFAQAQRGRIAGQGRIHLTRPVHRLIVGNACGQHLQLFVPPGLVRHVSLDPSPPLHSG
jgi:hypothetical protein